MNIDEALKRANPIGRSQLLLLILSGLVALGFSCVVLSTVFIAEIPPHHCAVCNNCTVEDFIPLDGDSIHSQCAEFGGRYQNITQECSGGWAYDTTLHGRSIVSEWDLVCARDSLSDLSQSLLLLGAALGSLFSGLVADKYGRRPISIVSLVVFNMLGVGISFSPNYAVFVTLRFLYAFTFRGLQLPLLITLFEYAIPEHRSILGNIPGIPFSLALVVMAWLAYWIRDWRVFHAVLMTPSLLTMAFIWFQPESVRWLASVGRYEEAEKCMQKVAKFNKVRDFPNPGLNATDGGELSESGATTEVKKQQNRGIIQLFRGPVYKVTFVTSWMWTSFFLAYFGFGLTTGSLASDPYTNFFLSGLVELPGRVIPMFIIKRFGNLLPLMTFQISSGLCMIAVIVIPSSVGDGWVTTSFALLGKFFTICAFPPINVINADLFPTTMRTLGQGFSQFVGNIGSIATPPLIYMDKFVPNLSLIVMASTSFISAFLCLLLPETNGHVQPESSEDLAELFRTKRLFSNRQRANDGLPSEEADMDMGDSQRSGGADTDMGEDLPSPDMENKDVPIPVPHGGEENAGFEMGDEQV